MEGLSIRLRVCRVKADATAFPHRQTHSVHVRVAYNWSDPHATEKRFAWGDEWLRLLRPQSDERIYANYQTYETKAGSSSIFGANHQRLLALKNKHDPTNLFQRNANITRPLQVDVDQQPPPAVHRDRNLR